MRFQPGNGGFYARGDVLHATLFYWSDTFDKTKTVSSLNQKTLDQLSKKVGDIIIKKGKDFIYTANVEGSPVYRFNERVAKACAEYVREAIVSNKYASRVPALKETTITKKKVIKMPVWSKGPRHIGVSTGKMIDEIRHFRTNLSGETRHTGFVVGIPMSADAPVHTQGNKKQKSQLFLKNKGRNSYINKGAIILSHDKMFFLERGNTYQPKRPIYSLAVNDFLREFGFVVPPVSVTTPSTPKKAAISKAGKARKMTDEVAVQMIYKLLNKK